MQAHGVGGRHHLHHILQDEEAQQRREVQLAKQGRQDAAVDLQVRLRDLMWGGRRGGGVGGGEHTTHTRVRAVQLKQGGKDLLQGSLL